MRTLTTTKKFQRDFKKHGELTSAYIEVLWKLLNDEALDKKYCDHQLSGELKECRDCHIKPDLVLIYRKYDNILELIRMGSHSELFK